MILFGIILIIMLFIMAVLIGIIGGTVVLFLDPIICILVIYGIYRIIKYFKDRSQR
jgi:hypothetical protein